jgi:cation diffusion facilitator family transporter
MSPTRRIDEQKLRDARYAMRLSLIVGLVMLVAKITAYFMTHSAAIFSDAAESVVHVVAVAFAAFSLPLSTKPAAPQFLYGYERITFFSAGFEGAMIISAAIAILLESIPKVDGRSAIGEPWSRHAVGAFGWNTQCGPRLLSPAYRRTDKFDDSRSGWQTRVDR